MNINICATPMSLAAFMVANVCDNVRLQYRCIYGIQEGVIAVAGVYCIGQLMIK